jgi:hypothetical protein
MDDVHHRHSKARMEDEAESHSLVMKFHANRKVIDPKFSCSRGVKHETEY